MGKITTIFFDLDRTLWDFEKNSEFTLELIFEEYCLSQYIDDFQTFLSTYKKINSQLWREYNKGLLKKDELRALRFYSTMKTFGVDDLSLGKKLDEKYISISPFQTHLFPHTKETLEILKDSGYQLNIITNGFTEVQHIKLKNCGLDPFFQHILCSEEIGLNKPHRKVFYEALNRAKSKISHSVMVGDDLISDIKGAENIGMRAILFDPQSKFIDELPRVNSLEALPELIINMR